MKQTPLQTRILVTLTDGPGSFNALLMTMGAKPDTLNRALAALIEAGLIERCQVGQGGGVRLVKLATGAAGENEGDNEA